MRARSSQALTSLRPPTTSAQTSTVIRLAALHSSLQSSVLPSGHHPRRSPCHAGAIPAGGEAGCRTLYIGPIRRSDKSPSSPPLRVMSVPQMGESITEGTVSEWKKEIGEFVKEDEVICVLDTDKVSVDIHAVCSGVVQSRSAETGDTVFVGAELVSIQPSEGTTSADDETDEASSESESESSHPAESRESKLSRSNGPTTSSGAHRVPLIRFPDRRKLQRPLDRSQFASPDSPQEVSQSVPSSASSAKGKASSNSREEVTLYKSSLELPEKYKTRLLTEEEIDIINQGGEQTVEWVTHTTKA